MRLFAFLKRNKHVETAEERRARLLAKGRITDGYIIDNETKEDGSEIVQYSYNVNGAEFESSETLTDDQRQERVKYAPGASVAVRYEPNNHGNSIIV